jgi:uncharacterized protein YjdB
MKSRLLRALAFSAVSLLLPLAATADDVTVGTVSANGSTVDVPVYIRDVAGSPLGMDRPAGSKIQSFSIKVDYSPASAVSSVTFSRAGITANLSPTSEFAPASAGSTSLLATFKESTNPIPFTLNGSGNGNLVAHLVFTLSASATPGSTITLSLDPQLTQLTDEGGTGATKETVANGRLSLTNGAITVAPLSILISPSSRSIEVGASTQLTVTASANVTAATTVSLSSSAPGSVSVPTSVVINAGAKAASFTVTGVALGGAMITATLPPGDGGASDTATVNVIAQSVPCNVPVSPQVTAPSTVNSAASYNVTWPAVTDATEYAIDESTDAAFSSPFTQTVTSPTASFSHAVSTDTRYYYRVRAYNRSGLCNVVSPASITASVLVAAAPAPLAKRVLAVVGSVPGGFGSYFRTSVQFYNAGSSAISGRIVFHPAGASASDSDPFLSYTLPAGKTLAYSDLLPALGVTSGIGSADVVADLGSSFPVAAVRVFNDGGAAGTTGLTQDLLRVEEALQQGQSGALIAPADVTRFRLNIGVRTLDAGATLTITVRNGEGEVVKTVQKPFGPSFFTQVSSAVLLDGYALTGGETLSFHVDSGAAFVYGATTDNTTNDPSQQFVRKTE